MVFVIVLSFFLNVLAFTALYSNSNKLSRSRYVLNMATMGRNLEDETSGGKIYYDYMKSDKNSPDSFPILYLPG